MDLRDLLWNQLQLIHNREQVNSLLPAFSMPCFDYRNSRTGEVREFIQPAAVVSFEDPDGSFWSKSAAPPRIAIGGYQEPSQALEVRKGYHRMEERGWRSKYTKNQIKKAWGI